MTFKEKVINKCFSGRFIMTVAFTLTICRAFLRSQIPPEAFIPMAILIVEWYFKRPDRKNGGM